MDEHRRRIGRDLVVIFLLALLPRLVLALRLPADDSVFWDESYHEYARNFSEGRGFWMPNPYSGEIGLERVYAFRPPLFPFLWGCVYGVTGGAYAPIRIAFAFLGSASCAVAYLAGLELVGRRKVALLGGLLCAFYPPLIWHSVHLMTEPLFIFFGTFFLFALFRFRRTGKWRWLIAAGVSAGLGTLSRSVLMAFLPVAAVWIWWVRGRRLRAIVEPLVFAAVVLAVMSPWVIRNAIVLRAFVPATTDAGHGFYAANNPNALADARGFWMPSSWAFVLKPGETSVGELEASSRLVHLTWRYLLKNPRDAAVLMSRRFVTLWRFYPHVEFMARERIWIYALSYVPLFPFVLFGLGLAHRGEKARLANILLVDLLVATTTAMAVVFLAMMRYRVPLMPFLLMFAALGISAAWGQIRTRGGCQGENEKRAIAG